MRQAGYIVVFATLLNFAATPANACVYLPADEIRLPAPTWTERQRLRAECWDLRHERAANLRKARSGALDANQLAYLAERYEQTAYGCPGDAPYAFDLLEAALPQPYRFTADAEAPEAASQSRHILALVVERMARLESRVTAERARELRRAAWLTAAAEQANSVFDPTPAEIDAIMADPVQRALAMRHRARHPAVAAALADPARPGFDRAAYAATLLDDTLSGRELVDAARLMLDPAHGAPEVSLAAQLLSRLSLSPYMHSADAQADAEGLTLLRQIGREPADNRPPEQLPANARVLDTWPAALAGDPQADPALWQRVLARIGENYPARARRLEEAGPVETALHYAADGSFVGYVVTRSSGFPSLDAAAVQGWTRYARPRPPAMLPAELIDGRDLVIRMPRLEYHLYPWLDGDASTKLAILPDGRIIIEGRLVRPTSDVSSCG